MQNHQGSDNIAILGSVEGAGAAHGRSSQRDSRSKYDEYAMSVWEKCPRSQRSRWTISAEKLATKYNE
jgi:hypothetical protein